MPIEHADPISQYLQKFDPHRDESDWVCEPANEYVERMQATLLPHWPAEALIHWLHRHNRDANRYAFLGFENLQFEEAQWGVAQIPGREAFDDPGFCDNFIDVERRARNPHDWLARYMLEVETWNTPIIVLHNVGSMTFPEGRPLNQPLHLLEGHRRLSFLNGLKRKGKTGTDPILQDSAFGALDTG